MLDDDTQSKLTYIIQGSRIPGQTNHCTTIRNHLCSSFTTGRSVKTNFEGNAIIKKEQELILRQYASENRLWINELPGQYLTRGGESQIYLEENGNFVTKINDAVYYATWLEYFNSLLLHNLFFPDTGYDFIAFFELDRALYAVVRQPFILADGLADLNDIRIFLEFNGFQNTKRQDYFNPEYGLILEDIHDENVIANSEKLFFIDTVFYIVRKDYYSSP